MRHLSFNCLLIRYEICQAVLIVICTNEMKRLFHMYHKMPVAIFYKCALITYKISYVNEYT